MTLCVLTRTTREAEYLRRIFKRRGVSADIFPIDEPKCGRRYDDIILTFDQSAPTWPQTLRDGYARSVENWVLALPPGKQITHLYWSDPAAEKALKELLAERLTKAEI